MKYIFVFFVILLYCCKGGDKKVITYEKYGRFLVKKSFCENGRLCTKQFYNNDTVPDGAAFEYYPNGKISEWQWFAPDDSDTLAHCVVEYDTNGVYEKFKGWPFVRVINKNDSVCVITAVHPPNIKYIILLVDVDNKGRIQSYRYVPEITDTTSWVEVGDIGESLYTHGHSYYMQYYIVNSSRDSVCEVPIELHIIDSNEYEFVHVTPHNIPLARLKEK